MSEIVCQNVDNQKCSRLISNGQGDNRKHSFFYYHLIITRYYHQITFDYQHVKSKK